MTFCCSEPGRDVLELCCGPGKLALEAAQGGAHVTEIDISPDVIEVGKRYQAGLSVLRGLLIWLWETLIKSRFQKRGMT